MQTKRQCRAITELDRCERSSGLTEPPTMQSSPAASSSTNRSSAALVSRVHYLGTLSSFWSTSGFRFSSAVACELAAFPAKFGRRAGRGGSVYQLRVPALHSARWRRPPGQPPSGSSGFASAHPRSALRGRSAPCRSLVRRRGVSGGGRARSSDLLRVPRVSRRQWLRVPLAS